MCCNFSSAIFWLPTQKGNSIAWFEAIFRLKQLRKQAEVIPLEIQKNWVSVIVEIQPNYWRLNFIQEDLIPADIDTIKIQTKTPADLLIVDQAGRRIEFESQADNLYFSTKRYVFSPQPLILTGNLDQIINLDVILKNQVSNQTFSPRAIRFINYLK